MKGYLERRGYGGYSEFVIDGIMYRLIECDGVEIFADRGLYLCISTSAFYDINAFNYNEETGEITPSPDYNGANALFNLPFDTAKADHEKAEKYLKELWKEPDSDATSRKETPIDWEKVAENGVVIPESMKKVTFDEDGLACYEYNGWKANVSVDDLFKEGETGIYKTISMSEGENGKEAMQFSKDANGVITGRIITLD